MPADASRGFRQQPLWLLAVALLVAGQAALALPLFGGWQGLNDDRPILDGRHPLHLYHGSLGAAAFRDRFAVTCYDPNFQAGYPKTPVFDGGCRPAEAFLAFSRKPFDPAFYKWGVFLVCAAVPWVLTMAARNFGLSPAGALLAGAAGVALWWLPPTQTALRAGQLDVLLGGLAALAFLGGLARYATEAAGPKAWLTLAVASVVGWYVQPVAWLGTIPVLGAYYILNAPRHGLAWHLGFFAILPAGLAPNVGWLIDWGKFWWLRQPFQESAPWPDWQVLLGSPAAYRELLAPQAIQLVPLIVGCVGLLGWVRTGRGGHSMLIGLSAACAALAARLGTIWPPAEAICLDKAALLIPALAAIPAAFAVAELFRRLRVAGPPAVLAAGLPLGFAMVPERVPEGMRPDAVPFRLGLTPEQAKLVQLLRQRTGPAARILIEEADTARPGWNWTALLPTLTDRAFLGGLDPAGGIEHLACGMAGGKLLNRPFAEWPPAERSAYCERYNVGWVVCRSEAAVRFWGAEPMAREIARFDDGGELVVFELDRSHSFVRSGKAVVEHADAERIVLRDLVPDEHGCVRLGFHFQKELRAAPLIVSVEADADPRDPVPLMKLRLPGPVSRVSLRWQHP
jgi:hypothetical protein